MRLVLMLVVTLLPGLAGAQDLPQSQATGLSSSAGDLVDLLRGTYGSATDPAGSCDTNPHQLDFLARPPHLMLIWPAPWIDQAGETIQSRRYDILGQEGNAFILRNEDETQSTDSGDRPIWILRPTSDPAGYCWGRTDWPAVRCEDQQLRCDKPVS